MSILLTGATGFVGRSVYQAKKINLTCVVRHGQKHNFNDVFEIDSIDSKTNWNGAFKHGVDSIIHLAGLAHKNTYTDDEYFEVNTEGTLHLASEAVKAGVKRFVFVSSIGVCGTRTFGESFDENMTPKPHNCYAESKYSAELGLLKIAEETGLEVVIVRPTLVYGAEAPGNFASLSKLVSKVHLLPFGLCENKRSFISVDNLSSFLHLCAAHPKAAGETFIISDGESVSIKEFTSCIAKGLGSNLFQVPVPIWLMNVTAKLLGRSHQADQLLGDLDVDSSKSRRLLNWVPSETMAKAMANLKK